MEKVYFENSKGDKLCGILNDPTSDKNNPIIVLCHGFRTCKDANTYVRLEKALIEKRIAIFRFDFYGHGESEGKFEDITPSEAVDDALRAIEFVKNRGYSKIGLFGSSFGGAASIMAASKSDDLYVLALKSPVCDYPELMKQRHTKEEMKEWKKKTYKEDVDMEGTVRRLNYSFLEDALSVSGYEACKKIRVPALIVHGDADESVPVEQSKKAALLMGNCRLEIVHGANHKYSKPEDFEKMLKFIVDFISST